MRLGKQGKSRILDQPYKSRVDGPATYGETWLNIKLEHRLKYLILQDHDHRVNVNVRCRQSNVVTVAVLHQFPVRILMA